MKIPRITRTTREGKNSPYRPEDQRILDQDNPALAPKTQLFTRTDNDLEEFRNEVNLCAKCGSKLPYLERTEAFICGGCHEVSQSLEDTKLKQTDQGLRPFQSQYYDANNPDEEPFFVGWNPDSGNTSTNKDFEVTYNNGRIKKVKCKGYPSDISINAFND
jgi:hypothetical protein